MPNSDVTAIIRSLHDRVCRLEGLYEDEPDHERDRCRLFQEGSDPDRRYGLRGLSVCKPVYDYLKALYDQDMEASKEAGKKWYVQKGYEFVGADPKDDFIRLDIESLSGKRVGSRLVQFAIIVRYFPFHKRGFRDPEKVQIYIIAPASLSENEMFSKVWAATIRYDQIEQKCDEWAEDIVSARDPRGTTFDRVKTNQYAVGRPI